jgi:hypothetical protein
MSQFLCKCKSFAFAAMPYEGWLTEVVRDAAPLTIQADVRLQERSPLSICAAAIHSTITQLTVKSGRYARL